LKTDEHPEGQSFSDIAAWAQSNSAVTTAQGQYLLASCSNAMLMYKKATLDTCKQRAFERISPLKCVIQHATHNWRGKSAIA